MQKDSTKQKALDFLDWMDTHYEDWVSVSCSIDTCELSDADTIHILNKAYENGLVELFFAYFMNVREARAIEETRDRSPSNRFYQWSRWNPPRGSRR